MKRLLLVLFSSLLFSYVSAQSLKGTWIYKMASAPYGYEYYSKGKVQFKTVDKKQLAVIMFDYDERTVELKKVEKGYRGTLYMEGADVDLTFSEDKKGQLKAFITIDGVGYDVKFEKPKK